MTTMAFDTLRYARRLREAGVPEPQANVQAELMAEAFGFYADNLLTKDYFHEVLDARFAEQEARFDAKLVEQESRYDARFARQDRILVLHTWMLGLIILVLVVPQLQAWLA
ncbi:hypothetical protein [Pseudohaliea sp.]|uniref:hypothetical protein n=1 Tax=Pseudohaliea sp. TaxID=2740289 RepID=UPI0032F090BF